jgi:hypothetical protein
MFWLILSVILFVAALLSFQIWLAIPLGWCVYYNWEKEITPHKKPQ